jgi:alpha-L-rhamnosidase
MQCSLKSNECSGMVVTEITCNYLKNPLGVETQSPCLSWVLDSHERDQCQTAYRILVASSEELLNADYGDTWDSGRIESSQSIHVSYDGKRLASRQRYYWKVQTWDKVGRISQWSEVAYWEMGILDESEWQAQWIGSSSSGDPSPAPLLRSAISLDKAVGSARAYICGLGYYELYINGSKIGDEVLAPAFTRYDKTSLYQTHDITNELVEGENAIGVMLGNGWYNCFTKEVWNFEQAPWRDTPKLLLQIHIRFIDGTETVIVSDNTWRSSTGPITFDGLRNGEFYDARLEKEGWNMPDYDDSDWKHVRIVPGPGGILRSQQLTPIRITKTIEPIGLNEVRPGVWVYDLGQNISGWAQLTVRGPEGATITLKYAEKLREDGDIDDSNIKTFVKSGEFQTDKYTLKGSGTEVWEPRFTYHGFQYIQMTGFPGTPTLDNLRGRVVHTAFQKRGEFSCSNPLLNTIQQCAEWSTLTNYHGIPTDCPHREKNGWTGDAHLSTEQVLFNFDPMTAYRKWMSDFRDAQRSSGQLPGIVPTGGWGFNWGRGPAWDSAAILIPWYLYAYCGDLDILREHYACMKSYVDFVTTMASDHIVNFGLGDWCPPVGGSSGHKCPTAVTDTAYYYVDAYILAKAAKLLGNEEDAVKYGELAEEIRKAFRRNFMNLETGQVAGDCQTSIACALYQGLVDEPEKPKFAKALVKTVEEADRHIDCGILGTKYIMHSLTELDYTQLCVRKKLQLQ